MLAALAAVAAAKAFEPTATATGVNDSQLYFFEIEGTNVYSTENITISSQGLTDPSGSDVTWFTSSATAITDTNVGFLFSGDEATDGSTSPSDRVVRVQLDESQSLRVHSISSVHSTFQGRVAAAAAARGAYAYVTGGAGADSLFFDDAFRCDEQSCVKLDHTMSKARAYHAMVAYQTQLWAIGGGGEQWDEQYLSLTEIMPIPSGDNGTAQLWYNYAWSNLPGGLQSPAAVVIKNSIVVLAGQKGELSGQNYISTPFAGAYIYNGSHWKTQPTILVDNDLAWQGAAPRQYTPTIRPSIAASGAQCGTFYLFAGVNADNDAFGVQMVLYEGSFRAGVVALKTIKVASANSFTNYQDYNPMLFFDRPSYETCTSIASSSTTSTSSSSSTATDTPEPEPEPEPGVSPEPTAAPTGATATTSSERKKESVWWIWIVIALLPILVVGLVVLSRMRGRSGGVPPGAESLL